MNEKVLDTLMQLFALIAQEGGVKKEEQRVIRNFLFQQLSDEAARQYMDKFYAYSNEHITQTAAQLCEAVNASLTVKQKYYIMLRLLELIVADKIITDFEGGAIEQVRQAFNIAKDDYNPVYEFITTDKPRQLLHQNMLIISQELGSMRGSHMQVEQFIGYIAVLHLEVVDVYVLRYIGNGEVYLNGQPLRPDVVYLLNPGSVIRTPKTQPIYFSDVISHFWEPRQKGRIAFSAQNISYTFPAGNVGLHSLSIHEQTGRLVALMGASGAGKSTLLNVLNGSLLPSTGSVTINGIDIHTRADQVQGIIGFVSQDDLLMEELTVYENLYFNAKLCFSNYTPPQLQEIVNKTLDELGLLEIKDLKVGSPLNKKISGGQRKRLNIALELIREPGVLFLDEPTSGLSSRDSENVMDLLKEQTLKGKLVFVVIHQPSSDIFKMFDRLFLLDKGGYPIFYGNPLEAVRYFRAAMNFAHAEQAECDECGNVNPEQIFTIIDTELVDEYGELTGQRKMTPERWHALYQEKVPSMAPIVIEDKPVSDLSLPGRFKQLRIFLQRDVLSKVSNLSYMLVTFLEAPLLALALAYLLRYYNNDDSNIYGYTLAGNVNLPAYILTCILVAMFLGLTVSAEEILRDRKIRKREAFLHLSRHSYLLSKVVLLFTISAIQVFCYVAIGHGLMTIEGLTPQYWLMLFSLACFANMLGLNISSTFDSAVTIYILVPILLIPQIILSGALVKFDELNPNIASTNRVPTVADLMASRWAYEALAVTQYKDNLYERNFYAANRSSSEAQYYLNNWLPKLQDKLDYVFNHYQSPQDADEVRSSLHTLYVELSQELARYDNADKFAVLGTLQQGRFTPEVGRQVQNLLNALQKRYGNKLSEATTAHEALNQQLRQSGQNPAELKRAHHNERLAEVVTNRLSTSRIAEVNDHLVPLIDPIYRTPAHGPVMSGQAHMYAPHKYLLGRELPTFVYNLLMLWLMTLVLYVTLYIDLLRRLIGFMGYLVARVAGPATRLAVQLRQAAGLQAPTRA